MTSAVFSGSSCVAHHQAERAHGQVERHLALVGRVVVGVEQHDLVARQRAAHRAGLDRLAGRVADLRVVSVWPKPSRMVRPQAAAPAR
jgi:hypothetical protein